MKIGIDIDDVITETYQSIRNYIDEYDKNGELSNYMEDVMRGDMTNPTIKKFFEDNCISIFDNAKTKENADKVMQRLLDRKNEIFIITTRGEIRFKGSEELSLEYLKKHNIPYTKVLWNSFDKAKICKENNIDVMIDDSVKYCMEIKENNINSILFTSEVNKSIDVKLPRVNNWLELEIKLNEMCN